MNKLLIILLVAFSSYLSAEVKTFLVFGGSSGWIGQKVVKDIENAGHCPVCAKSRLENREGIIAEIKEVQPDYIVNVAGLTGKPNVDWCETHKIETIRVNVMGTLNLADVAYLHGIHFTNFSTGCIYEYDEKHPMWSGIGFTEEEKPNFDGSYYSRTKIILENLLLDYPNVLNLRIKMPISTDMNNGFVAKIVKFDRVVNIPNSLCVLETLLPKAVDMTLKEVKGNFNFVNPGALSHNQVLQLYKEHVDPSFTWKNFSLEEHDQIMKARRANAELSADKLLALYPDIPNITDALILIFKEIRQAREQ